jgi:cell division protein FtsL
MSELKNELNNKNSINKKPKMKKMKILIVIIIVVFLIFSVILIFFNDYIYPEYTKQELIITISATDDTEYKLITPVYLYEKEIAPIYSNAKIEGNAEYSFIESEQGKAM